MAQGLDDRQLLTRQEADQCAAAGADIVDLLGLAVFGRCRDAIAAADDGICLCCAEGKPDGFGTELCRLLFKDTHGAVDEHGRGIKLLPGDYTLSIAGSPIAADGTIYTVPTTKAQVSVKSDGQDLSAQASFKLKVPSADTVTDDQIDAAAKYAEEGGCSSAAAAKILQQAATARRDAAANAVSASEAQSARDADARHKATDLYQLDIPVEWYGKVATWQNGSTLCIYLAGDTNTPLVTLVTVRDGESFTPDEGDAVLGAANLGNGYTVYASGPVYPYVVPQTINGRTQDPVSTYPMDTAVELVELTTGNRYTYSQIKNVLVGKDGNADSATKLETDYLAQILMPSIKAQD